MFHFNFQLTLQQDRQTVKIVQSFISNESKSDMIFYQRVGDEMKAAYYAKKNW